ncbi:MAG: hypothetical protein AAGA34_01175 [Pseudomonadota bacterium]
MSDLAPIITVSTDLPRGLVKFAASGLWGEEQVKEGSAKIGLAAAPFVRARKPFSILADYSEAIVAPREATELIRDSFVAARKMGLQRIAVFNAPVLVQMQYKRLADVVAIAFFDSKIDALAWLREAQADADPEHA